MSCQRIISIYTLSKFTAWIWLNWQKNNKVRYGIERELYIMSISYHHYINTSYYNFKIELKTFWSS